MKKLIKFIPWILLAVAVVLYITKHPILAQPETDVNNMTVGQLVDASLEKKGEIEALQAKKLEMDTLIQSKLVVAGGMQVTQPTAPTPTTEVDTALNLK